MKASLWVGLIFGIITLINNIYLILPIKNQMLGIILASGVLFFNSLFSVLFTKKENGYHITFAQGLKASVQSGMLQGLFYFLSIVLIQNYVSPQFFPELNSWKQYLLVFNINIILFSIFSAIFGVITSSLLHNKK